MIYKQYEYNENNKKVYDPNKNIIWEGSETFEMTEEMFKELVDIPLSEETIKLLIESGCTKT